MIEKEKGLGYRSLSKKYKLNISTIKNWCRDYQSFGIESIRRSMRKTEYSDKLKLSVLRFRQEHGLFYRETAKHFQIKNLATIANWNRIYCEEGIAGLSRALGRPKKDGENDMSKRPQKPRQLTKSEWEELQELRERNEYL
ncbi:hypothetical protein [Facklamia sp. P12950]|uniref:hypothetical protein n=1 Tax=Facklamia sp. P12950 TaxID=3421951 RepID=UPI003D17C281